MRLNGRTVALVAAAGLLLAGAAARAAQYPGWGDTGWVYARNGAVWGTALLVWSIVCGTFDNFLRPFLIKRGADLPLLLIFAGVIGGLIAFGVIGLFIGPVVLAVAYTLLVDWVSEGGPHERQAPPLSVR